MFKKRLRSKFSTKEVLLSLLKMAGYSALAIWSSQQISLSGIGQKNSARLWLDYKRELYYLKRRGYIKIGQNKSLALTENGLNRIKEILPETKQKLKNKQYVIVIFDIPEKYRKGRDSLRYFLKDIGFEQLQESVWITRYDVSQEIIEYINNCDISPWVNVIITNKIAFMPKNYEKIIASL